MLHLFLAYEGCRSLRELNPSLPAGMASAIRRSSKGMSNGIRPFFTTAMTLPSDDDADEISEYPESRDVVERAVVNGRGASSAPESGGEQPQSKGLGCVAATAGAPYFTTGRSTMLR
jgi:hypothetical protein